MPDRFVKIILRLLLRLCGLGLVVFSLVFLLSLLSFNSEDPSFNTVSTNDYIDNWMGSFGSHISDLSFQLIGVSSFFLCLIIFVIGSRVSSRFGITNLLPKIIITPFAILCCSTFFATLPQPSWWEFNSLGGVNGSFIVAQLSNFPIIAVSLFFLFLAFFLISIVIEISFKDWFYFLRYALLVMSYLYSRLSDFVKSNSKNDFRPRQGNIEVEIPEEESVEEEEEDEPNVDEEEEVEETREVLKEKLKSTKTKKPTRPKKSNYQLPTNDLLTDRSGENKDKKISRDIVEKQSEMLLQVLDDFGVQGNLLGAKVGPVVTLHEFEPVAGTKASRVIGLSDDIARSMSAVSARIAVVLGKTSIGIELPNPKREMIFLRELIESKDYKFS